MEEHCDFEDDLDFDWDAPSGPQSYFTKREPLTKAEIRREKLRLKVLFGELSPEQAEEAVAEEKAPFKVTPEPMFAWTMPDSWSPEMTAIWITTLKLVQVQRHIKNPHPVATAWVPNREAGYPGYLIAKYSKKTLFAADERLLRGHSLIELKPTFLFEKFHDFDGALKEFPKIKDWYPKWQSCLYKDTCKATGIELATGKAVWIEWNQWPYATFAPLDDETVLCIDGAPRFRNVRFKASDIMNEFPPVTRAKYRPFPPVTEHDWPLPPKVNWLYERMRAAYGDKFPLKFESKAAFNADLFASIPSELLDPSYENCLSQSFVNLVNRTVITVFGSDWPTWSKQKL